MKRSTSVAVWLPFERFNSMHSRLLPRSIPCHCAIGVAVVVMGILSMAARAQDSADSRLPESARLALRAKPGDLVKMQGEQRVTTHIHLEAITSEFSTESHVKDNSSFEYRGRGANGTLQFDIRSTSISTVTTSGGQAPKSITRHSAGLYTVKPNMEVVRLEAASGTQKSGSRPAVSARSGAKQVFGVVRFPDRALKSGDSWSGSMLVTDVSDISGITVNYQATLVAFELYQNFPCARVETTYSYKGRLPSIEAQIRKGLPAGAKLTDSGELTGTETTYYALDRGWPLNDEAKVTVALNFTLTTDKGALEFGGTIDTDSHSGVSGYPAYDASLVPKSAILSPPK